MRNVEAGRFHLEFDADGGLHTLADAGHPRLRYVAADITGGSEFGAIRLSDGSRVAPEWAVLPADDTVATRTGADGHGRRVEQQWSVDGETLRFRTRIEGLGAGPLEMAVPFNTRYVRDPAVTYRERVVRHDDMVGSGGFCYATPADGDGPFLVLTPDDVSTAPDGFVADTEERDSGWEGPAWIRFDEDAVRRATDENVTELSFRFDWAEPSHQAVRDLLFEIGSLDVVVTPGLVIPTGTEARMAVRGLSAPLTVASNVDMIDLEPVEDRGDYQILRLRPATVGELTVTVSDTMGRTRLIRFFVCAPLEELLEARRGFIIRHQQYRGPAWYDGLFSNWDMSARRMTTPDDPLGLDPYMVGGSDDPTLCKAPLLAELAHVRADQDTVSAIDYYIDRFVVGGLQRVDEVPHAYGVYGTPNWWQLRGEGSTHFSNGGHGHEHLWRTFDYPHLVQLYLLMARLAEAHPDLRFSRSPERYLTMAARTALAYFEVPSDILMHGWAINGYADWAFKQGNFHEVRILDVIDALEAAGSSEEAAALREHWEAKVRYMLFDHPHPFGSEMYFDSTAFESTFVVGRYARDHPPTSDGVGWFDRNALGPGQGAFRAHPDVTVDQAQGFLDAQARANMAARGMVETTWWMYGSDIRQHGSTSYMLSYMTALGGWTLVEWGLDRLGERDGPTALRAGFAAQLATFALVHSGADYPWWPSEENRGAAAWAFAPQADDTWMGRRVARGPWPVDGEIDSGLSAAVRSARCIVIDDPVFGVMALGGRCDRKDGRLVVTPHDGVRQRVDIVLGDIRQQIVATPHRIRQVVIDLQDPGTSTVLLDGEDDAI